MHFTKLVIDSTSLFLNFSFSDFKQFPLNFILVVIGAKCYEAPSFLKIASAHETIKVLNVLRITHTVYPF